MSTLLDVLYKEYKELKDKLDKVSDLIISYGGQVPINVVSKTIKVPEGMNVHIYPYDGTWKDKIMYALKILNRPATAKEIADFIFQNEEVVNPETEMSHIQNMCTQYTSSMGKSGDLDVDNSEFRNKYSISLL